MSPSPMIYGDDEMQEKAFAKKGCFCFPCFGGSRYKMSTPNGLGWWERMQSPKNKEHWWGKIREWSELVAVRKWKTFVRGNGYIKQGSFRYDPLSYARNFDDGTADKRDQDFAFDFASRYASVPASAKSSMDLGKDGPSFTSFSFP